MTDRPDAPGLKPESAAVWRRAEIESPCVNVCVLHPGAKICVGCLRTGEKPARW